MKTYNLEDFLNPERKAAFYEKHLEVLNKSNPSERSFIRRQRDPEEQKLLKQAVMDTIKDWERKGVLERDGRIWKLYF